MYQNLQSWSDVFDPYQTIETIFEWMLSVNCTDQSGNGLMSEYKTLIVVVRASSSMAANVAEIAAGIDRV